ncbi:MAG: hypothetical protein EOP36_05085 [Rubrivivax sp.]|nr:MAG: hypothetical protein EOP36_05085 [Rubrivivax sp.]
MKPHKSDHKAGNGPTGMLAYLAHISRAMFQHHDDDEHAQQQAERYWALMYVDTDGVLQNTTVSVLAVHPGLRSVTVRRESDEQELILRVSKIVEAIDIRTGRRIDLGQWLAQVSP